MSAIEVRRKTRYSRRVCSVDRAFEWHAKEGFYSDFKNGFVSTWDWDFMLEDAVLIELFFWLSFYLRSEDATVDLSVWIDQPELLLNPPQRLRSKKFDLEEMSKDHRRADWDETLESCQTYRCNVGLFGGRVEVLPKWTGVRGVTGKAGVSGRETSVSVSERYDNPDSLRTYRKEDGEKPRLILRSTST